MREKGQLDQITRQIIGAPIEVHKAVGPGLLESAYQACLAYEVRQRGFKAEEQQVGLLINFHNRVLKDGLKRIVNEFPDSAISAFSAVNGL
jgi:hypothetical protein